MSGLQRWLSWSKAHDWKSCLRGTVTRVRIPFSAPNKKVPDSWVYVRQYCAKIDEAARNRMELIVPELAKRNGVTEKLKADTKWNGYGR